MLSGRIYAITGANTGVGRATAMALAERGAHLLLLCRNAEAGARVVSEIAEGGFAGTAELIMLDLADLDSVRHAAQRVAQRAPRIDGLINNAGVGGARGLTRDGFELAFGVNYLGHYALTRRLMEGDGRVDRVVHVTSGSHARAKGLDFEALRRPTRSLTGIAEYAVSKLAVMLFHHEMSRRSTRVISLAADPGDVASDAWRHLPCVLRPLLTHGMKSPREGARTSVYCATEPALSAARGASFVGKQAFEPSPLSLNTELARVLWRWSADQVGLAS